MQRIRKSYAHGGVWALLCAGAFLGLAEADRWPTPAELIAGFCLGAIVTVSARPSEHEPLSQEQVRLQLATVKGREDLRLSQVRPRDRAAWVRAAKPGAIVFGVFAADAALFHFTRHSVLGYIAHRISWEA